MPSNPASRALLNNDSARKYAFILFINNFVLGINLILVCVSQDWSQVLFAAMSVIVGICMLTERSSNIIKMDKLLCFVILSMYMVVVQFVHTTMLFVNPVLFNKDKYDKFGWELYMALFANCALFVCFMVSSVIASLLYNNLRKTYEMAPPQQNQGGMFGNMFGGGQPNQRSMNMQQRPQQQQPQQESYPSANTSNNTGVVPFSGQGQRLGN